MSEGALLVVAAQAGFIDGPRVLANMAVDSWMPHRFSALSDRLTTQNGIVLMGAASLAALLYTLGDVRHIVVMYSINVFLTFSLSLGGMAIYHLRARDKKERWIRRTALFVTGFVLCGTILAFTVMEKFLEGGWITLLVTGSVVLLCFLIRGHYRAVSAKIAELPEGEEEGLPAAPSPAEGLDLGKPTAAILVAGYGKLGIRTVKGIFDHFPGHFAGVVFLTVGVVDSGAFKGGENALASLREHAEETAKKYVALANRLGLPADYRFGLGTDVAEEAEKLCLGVAR
ncbi:MAG: amino acid transporter, partial [Chloroflexota bacterium]